MLKNTKACAVLAVKDLAEARQFYEETLGFSGEENPGGILYSAGDTKFLVYESSYAGTNQATAIGFVTDDVESEVNELKGRGVTFERYDDLPGVTREGDIHNWDSFKAAWFKDPAGNILNISNEL